MAHMPVDERRPQLIAAAIRVISREGVTRATTRRIAEEAGAPLASLHYSFGNKEELFAAVTREAVVMTENVIASKAIAAGAGVRSVVRMFIELFRDWTLTDPDLQIAQYELQMWSLRTPGHAHVARDGYRLYTAALAGVLESAAAPAEHDTNFDRLARVTIAAVDGMIMQLLSVGVEAVADIDPDALAEALVNLVRTTSPVRRG